MSFCFDDGVGRKLQEVAREQMKLRLLADIRMDIMVSQLENMDYKQYLIELRDLIDGFLIDKSGGD